MPSRGGAGLSPDDHAKRANHASGRRRGAQSGQGGAVMDGEGDNRARTLAEAPGAGRVSRTLAVLRDAKARLVGVGRFVWALQSRRRLARDVGKAPRLAQGILI